MGLIIAAVILTIITFIGVRVGASIVNGINYGDRIQELDSKLKYEQITLNEYGNAKRKIRSQYVNWNKFSFLGFLWLLIILPGCYVKVGPNQVGIIYDMINGGVQSDKVYSEGGNFKTPFEDVTMISTTNKTRTITTFGQTSDSEYGEFDMTIIYKIETELAGAFYKEFSSDDIPEEVLNAAIVSALQATTTQYTIYEILGSQLEDCRQEFTTALAENLNKYNVTLVTTSFNDIDGGADVEAVIKALTVAKQQAEIAIAEAEAALEIAKGEAAVLIAKGEAEAEVAKILADAEAYVIEAEKDAFSTAVKTLYYRLNSWEYNLLYDVDGNIVYGEEYIEVHTYDEDGEIINTTYEWVTNNIPVYTWQATGDEVISIDECVSIVLEVLYYDNWNGELPLVTIDFGNEE